MTRPKPYVDRLACAWLIRRFISPRAEIRYAANPEPDEVTFDMESGQFSHLGNLCTFEMMMQAFGLDEDAGARAMAEIVHEIDLRDGVYTRPEIVGIDTVLKGWAASSLTDADVELRGIALFEGLYTALASQPRPPTQSRKKH